MSYRKLSPDLHLKILEDPRQYKEIAEAYGVHKDTVGRIKRNYNYRRTLWHEAHLRTTDKAN